MFTLLGYTLALAPVELAALALTGFGALAAAHLVGRRRRRLIVSTIDPWSLPPGPVRRTRLGWRMQRWLAFLLHAGILLLLLLALADPRSAGAGGGRSIALLLDRSASMGTVAGGQTRLELARREARAIAAGLGPGDQVLVAAFARQLEVETGWTGDRALVGAALDRIEPGAQADDLAGALRSAARFGQGRKRFEIVVLGDGRTDAPPDNAALAGAVPVRYVPVGAPADNVGIVELSVARAADEPGRAEAWLRLQASRANPGRARVELVSVPSGRRIELAELDLPASGSRSVRLGFSAAGETAVAAHLRDPGIGPGNGLAIDDHAVAALPPPTRRRLLLVSAGNHYLAGALRSFGAGLTLEERTPSQLGPDAPLDRYDVVVFDGVAPAPLPVSGRYLYLDPSGPGSPLPVRGQVRIRSPPSCAGTTPCCDTCRWPTSTSGRPDGSSRAARTWWWHRRWGCPSSWPARARGCAWWCSPSTCAARTCRCGPPCPCCSPMRSTGWPLRPATALDRGTEVIDPTEVDTRNAASRLPAPTSPERRPGSPGLAQGFLLLALALALLEWWAHQRRWTS